MSKFKNVKDISESTKKAVLERQKGKSISGVPLYNTVEYHHVRFRSDSGVGYEWNIVALTFEEHRLYHDKKGIKINGRNRYTWQEFDTLMKNHLKYHYPNWTWEKTKYQKYWSKEDYNIERRKI